MAEMLYTKRDIAAMIGMTNNGVEYSRLRGYILPDFKTPKGGELFKRETIDAWVEKRNAKASNKLSNTDQ